MKGGEDFQVTVDPVWRYHSTVDRKGEESSESS